jgi:hypothetical protein
MIIKLFTNITKLLSYTLRCVKKGPGAVRSQLFNACTKIADGLDRSFYASRETRTRYWKLRAPTSRGVFPYYRLTMIAVVSDIK